MAELMLGQPLFPGESGIDQLVEIIKVLGTPSREQIKTMNPNYMEHKFPQIKPHPFSKVCLSLQTCAHGNARVMPPFLFFRRTAFYNILDGICSYNVLQVFRPRTAPEAIDIISKLLEYTPGARLSAVQAMVHPFFDELRQEDARMPNGKDFPPLFNFTREGEYFLFFCLNSFDFKTDEFACVELSVRPDLIRQLVPPHCEPELASRLIRLDNFEPIPLEQLKITLD